MGFNNIKGAYNNKVSNLEDLLGRDDVVLVIKH